MDFVEETLDEKVIPFLRCWLAGDCPGWFVSYFSFSLSFSFLKIYVSADFLFQHKGRRCSCLQGNNRFHPICACYSLLSSPFSSLPLFVSINVFFQGVFQANQRVPIQLRSFHKFLLDIRTKIPSSSSSLSLLEKCVSRLQGD